MGLHNGVGELPRPSQEQPMSKFPSNLGFLCVLLLSVPSAEAKKPALERDAAGRPLFDNQYMARHEPGKAYECFRFVWDGTESTSCHVTHAECSAALDTQTHEMGRAVLSACQPTDTVTCFESFAVALLGTAAVAECFETPEQCEEVNKISIQYRGERLVSTCKTLDKSFTP
jgi:hypothetical protein